MYKLFIRRNQSNQPLSFAVIQRKAGGRDWRDFQIVRDLPGIGEAQARRVVESMNEPKHVGWWRNGMMNGETA